MEQLRALSSQQLVIAASGSLLVGSLMLSHGDKLGYLLVGLAVACGIGALVRYKRR